MDYKKDIKDLDYWKNNAEENYITTPISVLKYITKLEEVVEKNNLSSAVVNPVCHICDTPYTHIHTEHKFERLCKC